MSFSERFRKAKVVAKNINSALGAVGSEFEGGLLSGKKPGVYKPVRYKPKKVTLPTQNKERTILQKVVYTGKKLGDLSSTHNKYGFEGTPQLHTAQSNFFYGKSGKVSTAQEEYFGKGSPRMTTLQKGSRKAGSLNNPFFKYGKI